LWAGGNGRASDDDANFDGYANSIYVIAVGAVSDAGVQAPYSERGANLLICTPSDGGSQGLSTTDLAGNNGYNNGGPGGGPGGGDFTSGDYTNDFGGTSASAPVAAGAAALLLQSNPTLGWRDVKEILIRSAARIHESEAGWFDNAAGFHFNDRYGAGLLDVQAAVNLAATWTNLPAVQSTTVDSPGAVAIPDNSGAGAVKTFAVGAAGHLRVEHVALTVDVSHARRGQLQIELVSPSGTFCRLARPRDLDTGSGLDWTFTTPQFWGETCCG
jgi:kexin